jgi:hypothetical protein
VSLACTQDSGHKGASQQGVQPLGEVLLQPTEEDLVVNMWGAGYEKSMRT